MISSYGPWSLFHIEFASADATKELDTLRCIKEKSMQNYLENMSSCFCIALFNLMIFIIIGWLIGF